MSTRYCLWVRLSDRIRHRVSERGILIGRRNDCDIVVADPHASMVHTLLVRTIEGAEVHSLGLNPTMRNGKVVHRRAELRPGDRIELPGVKLVVEASGIETEPASGWLVDTGSSRHGLRTAISLGGGDEDDIWVDGWPPGALRLNIVQGGVVGEFAVDLNLGGEIIEAGSIEMLDDGDTVAFGDSSLQISASGEGSRATVRAAVANLPVYARLSFLPTGGELTMEFVDGARATLELSERRASLVACLLAPSGEYEAGDFVPDELLVGRVWPGQPDRGRLDVNTLVHRTRKDLVRAGVNPTPILARAKGGRATSFRMAPGGKAEVT